MIEATMLTEDGNYVGYVIEGHADYAEAGKDIVCCAVSVITQGVQLGLDLAEEETIVDKRPGYLSVLTQNKKEETNLFLSMLYEVIKDISLQYPNHVKVEIEHYQWGGEDIEDKGRDAMATDESAVLEDGGTLGLV